MVLSLVGWLYVLSLDENNTRLKAYLCSTVSEFVYQTAVAGRQAGGGVGGVGKGGERGPKEACAPRSHSLSMLRGTSACCSCTLTLCALEYHCLLSPWGMSERRIHIHTQRALAACLLRALELTSGRKHALFVAGFICRGACVIGRGASETYRQPWLWCNALKCAVDTYLLLFSITCMRILK